MEDILASWWLPAMLGFPWLGAILVALLKTRRRHLAGSLAFAVMVGSALALVGAHLTTKSGGDLTFASAWIPTTAVRFALRLDALSFPFVVNLLGVALIAIWYGWGYFHRSERLYQCYALILTFVGSMLGVLLADDAILFFMFWEAMLVSSSLLLAGWGKGDNVGAVTLKYFIYTQAGSLLLLVAIAWLVGTTGSSNLGVIATRLIDIPTSRLTLVAAVMFVAFGVKLAVAPLHVWLPDAHSIAPMPVTILLAAAMLSMGAYGMLRFPMTILGRRAVSGLQLPLLIIALASQVYGALMCLAAKDIKRIVAYSSVSQMGYVLFGLATLTPGGLAGGVFHVINHGIIKALLFMGIGMVMRSTERRRIDQLGGLFASMPAVSACILLASIALAGSPPFGNFHSEWLILSGGLVSAYPLLGYLAFFAPLLTAGYALWLSLRLGLGSRPPGLETRPVPRSMLWSSSFLVILSLVIGIYPSPIYRWAESIIAVLMSGVAS